MKFGEKIQNYWLERLELNRDQEQPNWIEKKKQFHQLRGNDVPRITGTGKVLNSKEIGGNNQEVEYNLTVTFFVKQGNSFYHEEETRVHRAVFNEDTFVEDQVLEDNYQPETPVIEAIEKEDIRLPRFDYDRRAAVRYAERWWNDYNPGYKKFDVDCTNFISQCLHAGGAPMRGAPDRNKGWWFQNNNWSYSWSVAHALRWYLSGSNQGLKGKELEAPSELLPGDIICYDFEGDGKWNHNTMVVEKDGDGMPLVNAHTNNSRHRYWSYEDSYAWTEKCQYKFFRIGE